MQRLNPLKVPWQVSPSTPFLRLLAAESSDKPSQVIFVAHFGLRAGQTTAQGIGFSTARQAANPHESRGEAEQQSATHSLIRIDFRGGLWARFSPGFSDREVLNPNEFDSSIVPYSEPPEDVSVWLRDFQSLWMKSGNCPDPGAYIVESSDWINRLSVIGFRHFLITGHDAYVEILARDWNWEEIQKLPEGW